METQVQTEMAQGEIKEEQPKDPVLESSERELLKELYGFMKKRDTPIERIPNLGFKQINLYVMYNTVEEMGGYHQVTAQQMWKQVYNTLGGNPRSTSAATCTRRHYEKLLLPFECHKKGISVSMLPHHQPKLFPFAASFDKEDVDGQRPAKRRLLTMPLQQNPHESDPHGRVFSMPLHYPPYYQQTHTVPAPHVSITSPVLTPVNPPAPQPWFTFQTSCLNPTERVKEPLEHLRSLAEQYKTSSGLAEPLNLSVKAPRQETHCKPVSSFAPPSSSKNPKFLNKPSTLYVPQSSQVRNEGSETSESDAGSEERPYSHPLKDREAYVVDVKAVRTSTSPRYVPTPPTCEDVVSLVQKSSSPKADFTIPPKEEGERYPDPKGFNLSQILPTLARENGGKMEIEIPLSLLHNWLKLCGSPAALQGLKQLTPRPPVVEQSSCSDADVLPTNLSFHMNPQQQSPVAEDLRLRKRHLPIPTAPTVQRTSPSHNTSQNPFISHKLSPSAGILKSAASRDVYSFDQPDYKCYPSKSPSYWDTYDKDTRVKIDSHSPLAVPQDTAGSKSYDDDVILVGKKMPAMAPSNVHMLGSGSSPLLQLTVEEVMKLKQIISSL
ncbi:AT-rich interaction domain 6 [Notolabrus celidotus]|uniref:AT-rich interaction domain 6 n=1 Tax=Notolabrus celidotus TaxID=1203425 RepID=UPI00148F5790|nr:AT-rich interaction domain 6 [Notolabrus celidotus]